MPEQYEVQYVRSPCQQDEDTFEVQCPQPTLDPPLPLNPLGSNAAQPAPSAWGATTRSPSARDAIVHDLDGECDVPYGAPLWEPSRPTTMPICEQRLLQHGADDTSKGTVT